MRAIGAVVLALLFTLLAVPTSAKDVPAGTVVFRSDFDSWDGRWVVAGQKDVVWVSGGNLVLGLDMDPAGWVRSARVDNSTVFTYGTFRARMRFTGPKGAHAAFWAPSVPVHGSAFCIDGCSEVDAAEHFGGGSVWHNVYWCPCSLDADGDPIYQNLRQSEDSIDPAAWHNYRVDWTPSGYDFFIDGVPTVGWTAGLSDKPHYLALSYLISAWERPNLQRDALGKYRTYVDWVELKANSWTTTLP